MIKNLQRSFGAVSSGRKPVMTAKGADCPCDRNIADWQPFPSETSLTDAKTVRAPGRPAPLLRRSR
jgi:hypothetical protein